MWYYYAGMAALSIAQGMNSASASRAAGRAARDAYYGNAADMLHYADLNAPIIMEAAARNAEAQIKVGYANADEIRRAGYWNMMMYGMQADEDVRRHVLAEKRTAGDIRAPVGASGVQTNTGTPRRHLLSQVNEGINQRMFMMKKHFYTLEGMRQETEARAFITELTAEENAAVIMSNAEAQTAMMLLDAERQAASMVRSGDAAMAGASAEASAAMMNGLIGAGGYALSGYSALSAPSVSNLGSTGTGGLTTSGFGYTSPFTSMNNMQSYMAGYNPSYSQGWY